MPEKNRTDTATQRENLIRFLRTLAQDEGKKKTRPKPEPRVRLNLDLAVQVRERLERLKSVTRLASLSDVVRKAIAIYEKVLQANGRIIIRHKDGTEENIRIP